MKQFLLSLLFLTGIAGNAQTCSAPAVLLPIVVSTSAANLSWPAPATGTPTGYQYAVTTSATPPTAGTATTSRFVYGYSITANTTYYLHVRTNCNGTYSSWTTSPSFIAIPGDTCSMAVNLATLTSPYTASTVGAADNYSLCGGTGGPDVIYYISVAAGSTLTIGQTNNNYNSKNFIGYGGACPGTTQINCLDDDYTTTTWTNTTGMAQTVYWVQYGLGFGSGNFTLAWSITAACQVPTNPVVTVIGTTANLSWTAPTTGSPTGYEYAVTTSAAPPANGIGITTETSITGYSLTAGNTYYLHVRTSCPGGRYSNWVTSASSGIPHVGDTCDNAIDLSTLISPISGTTVGATNDYTTPCGGGGAPELFYYIDVPNGYRLTIGQTTNTYDSLNYVSYGGNCPGTVRINCFDHDDYTSTTWLNTTGITQRVHWVQDGWGSSAGTFTLAWNVTRDCAAPTALDATRTSATTANFSWTAPTTGESTGYQYAVTATATPPTSGTATTGTSVTGYAITAIG